MKIGIISGSHRHQSQSTKVARYIERALKQQKVCDNTWLYDLAGNPLPMWDESIWSGEEKWQALLTPLSEELKACDAFVVVTPEWHGMAPAGLKNFFLMCSRAEVGHKPQEELVSADQGWVLLDHIANGRLCQVDDLLNVDMPRRSGRGGLAGVRRAYNEADVLWDGGCLANAATML